MASKDRFESLTEEVVCPICLDFFTDPVALECGHNFCRSCITQSWDREGRNSCPECREEFTDRTLGVSRALARLSEKARTLSLVRTEKESKLQCEEHQEELKLFCETDKKLICVICAAGREHKSHSFTLIAEAAEIYKDQVKSSIQSLTKEKSGIQRMEQQQKQKFSGVLEEAGRKQRFRDEAKPLSVVDKALPIKTFHCPDSFNVAFKKISDDLKSYPALRFGEVKVCSQKMAGDISEINDAFTSNSELRGSWWRAQVGHCLGGNIEFWWNSSKHFQCSVYNQLLNISTVRGKAKALLVVDEALQIEKFHCPVSFNKEISDDFKQVSFILDVETAHPQLEVSEDRKSVRWVWTWWSLPDTGKRFTDSLCVLGSEGFTSGSHYWEVEVAGSWGWSLGVAAESVERKREVTLTPETGVWSIKRCGDEFVAFTSPPSRLPVRPIPGRVGVYLCYESGTVSFHDADTKSHLHTFTGNKFTEKLYPFFWPGGLNDWLRICSGSAPGV